MTVLYTCRSCAHKGACEIQAKVLAAVKGLGVSSLKHRCAKHEPPYRVGQAVWAFVIDAPWSEYEESGEEPIRAWFPGHFIGVSSRGNSRALVAIAAGAEPREQPRHGWGDDVEFYPVHKKGICKIIWTRIENREAPDTPLCPKCGELKALVLAGECFDSAFSGIGACPMKVERGGAAA